ncbi:MAG: hypothetical protein ACLUE7_04955 [Lachnospirales bacterium]
MKRGVKMYYPDEVIDDIVSGNDIVDVIGSYVQLKTKFGLHMPLSFPQREITFFSR